MYEICGICDWEDDPAQSHDPDDDCGANSRLSLNAARTAWETHKDIYHVRL